MDKLLKLKEFCKCGIFLTINQHRDYYESVETYMGNQQDTADLKKEILQKMIEKNIIIELQFYPHTPIGSYSIYHYDIEAALDIALEILEEIK